MPNNKINTKGIQSLTRAGALAPNDLLMVYKFDSGQTQSVAASTITGINAPNTNGVVNQSTATGQFLTDALNSLKNGIDGLNNGASGVQGQISTLQTNISNASAAQTAALNSAVTSLGASIASSNSGLQSQITTISGNLTSLQTQVNGYSTTFTSLQNQINAIKDGTTGVTLNTLKQATDALNTSVTANSSAITTTNSQVATNKSNITTLQGQMSAANSNISTNSTNIATNTTNITGLRQDVSTLQSEVSSLELLTPQGNNGDIQVKQGNGFASSGLNFDGTYLHIPYLGGNGTQMLVTDANGQINKLPIPTGGSGGGSSSTPGGANNQIQFNDNLTKLGGTSLLALSSDRTKLLHSELSGTGSRVVIAGADGSLTATTALAAVGTSGSYTDLSNKPTISTVGASGQYADLLGKPTLFSGSYTDLTNKPTISTVGASGQYADLLGKPNLATVATSGSYTDLSNKPTIYSSTGVAGVVQASDGSGGFIQTKIYYDPATGCFGFNDKSFTNILSVLAGDATLKLTATGATGFAGFNTFDDSGNLAFSFQHGNSGSGYNYAFMGTRQAKKFDIWTNSIARISIDGSTGGVTLSNLAGSGSRAVFADANGLLSATALATVATTGNASDLNGYNTLATLTGAQTLTNKTLTSPTISTILNTGTLTLPTSTDTLVGRATADTLTNKTLTSPALTSPTITQSGFALALPTLTATDTLLAAATTATMTGKTFDTAGAGNVFKINGTQISANTGTGSNVLATSPTLTTPTLGVATATSLNKVTITAPTTSATLTLAQGSTLATSGAFSITLTATATTALNLPTTGTLATLAGVETFTNKTLTSPTINTPTLTVNDGSLTVQNTTDTTKKVVFSLAGLTTATTRTITVPDKNGTLAMTSDIPSSTPYRVSFLAGATSATSPISLSSVYQIDGVQGGVPMDSSADLSISGGTTINFTSAATDPGYLIIWPVTTISIGTPSAGTVNNAALTAQAVSFANMITSALTSAGSDIVAGTANLLARGADVLAAINSRVGSITGRTTAPFVSTQQTIATSSIVTVAHGLSSAPNEVNYDLVCVTADSNTGYAAGDVVKLSQVFSNVANFGITITTDATNLVARIGSGGLAVVNKTTGAVNSITMANWKLVLRAWL